MDIQKRTELLFRQCEQLKSMPGFYDAIALHYQLNLDSYKLQPLFYKIILQESRFNIVLAICCVIFGQTIHSVSEIKEICTRYKIASPNSVIAIVTLLKTGGRLSTVRDESDRRKVQLEATEKGMQDLKLYLKGAFSPLNILYPQFNLSENILDKKNIRRMFFSRAADMMFAGITYPNLLPTAGVFVNKDGGRLMMLHLLIEARKRSSANTVTLDYSQKKLAQMFAISRTHVRRVLNDAIECGLIEDEEGSKVTLLPAFFDMAETYVGLYFAWVLDYLDLNPQTLNTDEA